jgi:transcriptional regulator with XRE-family HTH domain
VTPDQQQRFNEELGARIAELRVAHDLTQQRLADALGISQQTLGHYEVGRTRFSVAILVELSSIFGMSVDEILGPLAKRGTAKAKKRR